MDYKNLNRIFFLGIGGIGMSAIARYFKHKEVNVEGYDKTYSRVTNDLEEEGIKIIYDENPELITEQFDLVVWTPAISTESRLYKYFAEQNIPIKKRSEVLGNITRHTECIAVAGTHGKTTVSTMIAHILTNSGKHCSAFLGGISRNYNTNFLYHENTNTSVVEADEFDRSFLQLSPYVSVITSTDADHLDIYSNQEDIQNTFSEFAKRTNPGGAIFYKKGIDLTVPSNVKSFTYSIEESADYFSTNIYSDNGNSVFNFNYDKTRIESLKLVFPGKHNVENATAAIAVSLYMGIEENAVRTAIEGFLGIERRFQFQLRQENIIYIDDYAHHPEEIRSALLSVKQLFPGKQLTVIFQPHLYSRTQDFAPEFAQSLSLANAVFLLPIYPAREKPIEGVSSQLILDQIDIKNKKLVKKEELLRPDFFKSQHLQIVMTLGAGDIGEMVPSLTQNIGELYPNG
ncbi:MAG: UDP-N-acetylmuramate--L-alanine ligase [Crocinitomicaceae bacterium]|nr:UDP-N-acetylmuramate--L-alanine ligase [Crocinitomicaceae bacterium]